MHTRIFAHTAPLRKGGQSILPLSITGAFASTPDTVAYSGYVTIVGALGDCTVQLLTGTLPDGATLRVDNVLGRVYIEWPEYIVSTLTIQNGNFESGNSSWSLPSGWSIVQNEAVDDPTTPTSEWTARYNGSSTQIMKHNSFVEIPESMSNISISCRVQQGQSAAGNAGAAVRLYFYDSGQQEISFSEGNLVDSAPTGTWLTSSGVFSIPANAVYVKPAARGIRKITGYPLYVDNFVWNIEQPSLGTNTNGSYPISLRVTDSGGRQATWSGTITVT